MLAYPALPPARCPRGQVERSLREFTNAQQFDGQRVGGRFRKHGTLPGKIGGRARPGRRRTGFPEGPAGGTDPSLLMCPGGDAGAGNQRHDEARQHKNCQGYWYEHCIPGSVAVTEALWASIPRRIAGTRGATGAGCSQHTRCRRPHVRHSYWPCEGHIGSACINLHQRSAILAWVGFIDPHSLAQAGDPKF